MGRNREFQDLTRSAQASPGIRIAVLGVGAMGCLIGARLAPHASVKMVGTWRAGVAAIRERGILIESVDPESSGNVQGPQLVQVEATTDLRKVGKCDLVIVARKAWQTRRAAAQATEILAPDGIVLTVQNGLGNLEIIQEAVGADRAALAVTTQGSSLVGPGHIRYAGGGPTHIGVTSMTRSRLERVAQILRRAGFETLLADDVQSLLWGKLAVNCGINALTALLRIPNGELLGHPDAESLMLRAALECAAVARAKGITLPYDDPEERVREVARLTAANRSSMLQDILRDAPTEIEAINGAVAREGARLDVPTPTNDVLWRLVRAISRRSSVSAAIPPAIPVPKIPVG